MFDEIRTYQELQKRMHEALQNEHPEWLDPNGDSPMLDFYDARFARLLAIFTLQRTGQRSEFSRVPSTEAISLPQRAVGTNQRPAKKKPVKTKSMGSFFGRH